MATVCELGARQEHPWTPRRGATMPTALSRAASPKRDARSRCGVVCGEITSCMQRAALCTATPRAASGNAQHRHWAPEGGRATRRCRRTTTNTVCDKGALHEARRVGKTRKKRGVAWRAVRTQAARKGRRRDGRNACDGKLPGSKDLPAEKRDTCLRLGHAARATLDTAAHRNKFKLCRGKPQDRSETSTSARCHGARSDCKRCARGRVARGNSP